MLILLLGGCTGVGFRTWDVPPSYHAEGPSGRIVPSVTPRTPVLAPKARAVARPPAEGRQPPPATSLKVGILVPLTGPQAPLGQALLNAAQMAVFEGGGTGFELLPRDTGETHAAEAARDALAAGARLLIGPVFASDVRAVAPLAAKAEVPVMALSSDVTLAKPPVWVMGFAPAPQVAAVTRFACDQGLRRFAAVIPSGAYGALVDRAFETAVRTCGGTVVARVTPARFSALTADRAGIDALFLPLGKEDLRRLHEQLSGPPWKGVRLLGTGLWDEPGLADDFPFLNGAWYASPSQASRLAFVEAYTRVYGAPPPRLATLAYDATALAAALAQRGGSVDLPALTNVHGFLGMDGLFRLLPDGQVERALVTHEMRPQGVRPLEAPLASFSP